MNLLYLAYAILVTWCEAAWLFAASERRLSIVALVIGQAYVLLATMALAYLFRSSENIRSALLQLALWSTIAGPFGALVAAGLAGFRWSNEPSDFGSWLENQVEPHRERRLQLLLKDLRSNRLRIEGASAISPFVDVFVEGGQREKFDVLAIIGRRFSPDLVPTIRIAEKDADASVRLLASSVKAKVQAEANKKLENLQSAAEISDSPEDWLALAHARLDYEALGLLGWSQRKSELDQAVAAIEEAARLAPGAAKSAEIIAEGRELKAALDRTDERSAGANVSAQARGLAENAWRELTRDADAVDKSSHLGRVT